MSVESELYAVLKEAIGADRSLTRDELIRAGVPSRYAGGIARASRDIENVAGARAVAAEWAADIEGYHRRFEGMSPAEQAQAVGRL